MRVAHSDTVDAANRRESPNVSGVAPAIFIAVFAVFIVGGALAIYRSDRRLAMNRAGRNGAHEPSLPTGTPVDVFVDPAAATLMARTAIQRIGGRDITLRDDGSVVGWIGSYWTNIPSKAQYMIAVARMIQSDGSVVLGCSCQPWFSTMMFGNRRSADLTRRLATEVSSLAADPTQ